MDRKTILVTEFEDGKDETVQLAPASVLRNRPLLLPANSTVGRIWIDPDLINLKAVTACE